MVAGEAQREEYGDGGVKADEGAGCGPGDRPT